eukprot:TRINITY_DN10538_c0_g1_i2.p1 TRINITY_DN10538_c0_g1~~TRINITY_DN10538_c0_g1_i2.p1  ORF type:complete len:1227 (+),score=277.20 TRINITY_DN10538_c0_g1_i2:100-3780(+)
MDAGWRSFSQSGADFRLEPGAANRLQAARQPDPDSIFSSGTQAFRSSGDGGGGYGADDMRELRDVQFPTAEECEDLPECLVREMRAAAVARLYDLMYFRVVVRLRLRRRKALAARRGMIRPGSELLLAQCPLFACWPVDHLERLLAAAFPIVYEAGEWLFHSGETNARGFLIVNEGWVDVLVPRPSAAPGSQPATTGGRPGASSSDERIPQTRSLGKRTAPQVLGANESLADQEHAVNVVCDTVCWCWSVPQGAVTAAYARLPPEAKQRAERAVFDVRSVSLATHWLMTPELVRSCAPTLASALTPQQLVAVVAKLQPMVVGGGGPLTQCGQRGKSLVFIRRGSADLFDTVGACFGSATAPCCLEEERVLLHDAYSRTARARGFCDCWMLELAALRTMDLHSVVVDAAIGARARRMERGQLSTYLQRVAFVEGLFAEMNAEATAALKDLASQFTPRVVPSGRPVAEAGAPVTGLTVITKGVAQVRRVDPLGREVGAELLRAGDHIGDSCLAPQRWHCTVVARSSTECWDLPAPALARWLRGRGHLGAVKQRCAEMARLDEAPQAGGQGSQVPEGQPLDSQLVRSSSVYDSAGLAAPGRPRVHGLTRRVQPGAAPVGVGRPGAPAPVLQPEMVSSGLLSPQGDTPAKWLREGTGAAAAGDDSAVKRSPSKGPLDSGAGQRLSLGAGSLMLTPPSGHLSKAHRASAIMTNVPRFIAGRPQQGQQAALRDPSQERPEKLGRVVDAQIAKANRLRRQCEQEYPSAAEARRCIEATRGLIPSCCVEAAAPHRKRRRRRLVHPGDAPRRSTQSAICPAAPPPALERGQRPPTCPPAPTSLRDRAALVPLCATPVQTPRVRRPLSAVARARPWSASSGGRATAAGGRAPHCAASRPGFARALTRFKAGRFAGSPPLSPAMGYADGARPMSPAPACNAPSFAIPAESNPVARLARAAADPEAWHAFLTWRHAGPTAAAQPAPPQNPRAGPPRPLLVPQDEEGGHGGSGLLQRGRGGRPQGVVSPVTSPRRAPTSPRREGSSSRPNSWRARSPSSRKGGSAGEDQPDPKGGRDRAAQRIQAVYRLRSGRQDPRREQTNPEEPAAPPPPPPPPPQIAVDAVTSTPAESPSPQGSGGSQPSPAAAPQDGAPAAAFDPTAEADALHAAVRGLGTDEDAITSSLQKVRGPGDWTALEDAFRERHPSMDGGDLLAALRGDLRGAEMDRCRELLARAGVEI